MCRRPAPAGRPFLGVSFSLDWVIRGVPWRRAAECIVGHLCSLFLNVSEMWRQPVRRAMASRIASGFCKSGFVFPLWRHYRAFSGAIGMLPPDLPSRSLAICRIFRFCFEMQNNHAKGGPISPHHRKQSAAAFVVRMWLNVALFAEMWCSVMRQNLGKPERRHRFPTRRPQEENPARVVSLGVLDLLWGSLYLQTS